MHVLEKPWVQGPKRQCSRVSDMQIHKYKYKYTNTNTASVRVAHRPNICYIFGMVMVRGPQKQWSRVGPRTVGPVIHFEKTAKTTKLHEIWLSPLSSSSAGSSQIGPQLSALESKLNVILCSPSPPLQTAAMNMEEKNNKGTHKHGCRNQICFR